jgi:hypothetical protein
MAGHPSSGTAPPAPLRYERDPARLSGRAHHPPFQRLPQVRQWLSNYQEVKGTIEAICELNPILPRPDVSVGKARSAPRD